MVAPVVIARERIAELRGTLDPEVSLPELWCSGTPAGLTRRCVAIVGTRAATPLGRHIARRMAYELARAGCTILSGLALGIDAAAHEGALDARGATLGILGGGHRRFFPRRNLPLAERMLAAGGAVLSPFAPDEPPRPGHFLARNGIVAALADALVVIEAPARSGALNTAGWAAGRIPVLAVPGDVDRPQVQGCLALLRDGATLARNAGDVLEALGLAPAAERLEAPSAERRPPAGSGGGVAPAILAALDLGEQSLDDLVAAAHAPCSAVLAALALLELDGHACRRGAATWARTLDPSNGAPSCTCV
ncbi:MAG: DNA-processing protein DprA [Vulcanimicrobiaceae bacterium]